jgi:HK97 gp10 family phage protein
MAAGAFLDIRVTGGKELRDALKRVTTALARRWIRGAVGEAANVVRDRAIANAIAVGLGARGTSRSPSGRKVQRHGLIPLNIRAWVEPSRGGRRATAGIRIKSRGRSNSPSKTFHWRWVEFGSVHNAPRPFWRPALAQAQAAAVAAAAEVISRNINEANRSGRTSIRPRRS